MRRSFFDIIHVHTATRTASVCILVGQIIRKPVIQKLTIDGETEVKSSGIRGVIENKLLTFGISRATTVVLTPSGRDEIVRFGSPDRCILIPNGVEIPARTSFVYQQPKTDQVVKLGFLGRLTYTKGIDLLLTLLDQLNQFSNRKFRLYLGGSSDGQYDGVGEYLAAAKDKLGEALVCLGELTETDNFFNMIDIYISLSRAEGIPNSVLESLASGKPAILSDIPGHRNIYEANSGSGVFLISKESLLYEEVARLALICETASVKLSEVFDIKRTAQAYCDLYKRVTHAEFPA